MAEDKTKFVRGNNLAPVDFDFDDANKIIKVKTDAVSSVGIAVAAAIAALPPAVSEDEIGDVVVPEFTPEILEWREKIDTSSGDPEVDATGRPIMVPVYVVPVPEMVLELTAGIGSGTQIFLPIGPHAEALTIDWGNGEPPETIPPSTVFAHATKLSNTYPAPNGANGAQIRIFGKLEHYGWEDASATNAVLIRKILKFNERTTSLSHAFYACYNLTTVPKTLPKAITDLGFMFRQAGISLVNQWDLGGWDTSNVTNMEGMFQQSNFLNRGSIYGGIVDWDTSNVTNMSGMFANTNFNSYLNLWDVKKVTNLSGMFRFCSAYNQAMDLWNTSSVTNLGEMFWGATAFNQDIGSWNTSSVTNMTHMFRSATAFNQNINNWNTSAVTNMSSMFEGAASYNQNLNNWNVSSVTNMDNMFKGATSFARNLSTWVTGLTAQPVGFSTGANATFANNANNLKPFLADGVTRINT